MNDDDVLDLGLNDENEFDDLNENTEKPKKIIAKPKNQRPLRPQNINMNKFLEKISGNITACQTEALKNTIEDSNKVKCCFISSPKGRIRHRLIASLFANSSIRSRIGLQVRVTVSDVFYREDQRWLITEN